jgi:hypothetical protein
LDHTGICDGGLESLRELQNLRTSRIVGSKATWSGMAELKKSLPKTAIILSEAM